MNRKTILYRAGIILAAAGASFAIAAPAIAAPAVAAPLFQASNVNVKVTGGEAIALNACIQDARDGVIQTQQQACNQIAIAGNLVTLENVGIYVQKNAFPSALLYQSNRATVELSGGPVTAYNSCVQDAQDGFIQTQEQACTQVATAGNVLSLSGVTVAVY